jgi:hypothetical protein
MRKGLAALTIVACLVALPILGGANDIPDGADCAGSAQGASVHHAVLDGGDPTTSELDRGAICVSDGNASNGAEVYLGGEAQAEEEGNPDAGGACGAAILGGQVLSGNPDWDNPGPDATPGTADDEHCD